MRLFFFPTRHLLALHLISRMRHFLASHSLFVLLSLFTSTLYHQHTLTAHMTSLCVFVCVGGGPMHTWDCVWLALRRYAQEKAVVFDGMSCVCLFVCVCCVPHVCLHVSAPHLRVYVSLACVKREVAFDGTSLDF